ncbi:MAG: hypothetical protein EP305_10385 [Bacteroidetes bacterium]|nr:MAG: hypothetical protein EP305_10385 [Bacteroidota bacterium]
MDKNTDFPQYRMISNGKAYYEIINNEEFTEVQLIGKKKWIHQVKAVQYPEKLRIMDMLRCEAPFCEISKIEFEKAKNT